MADQAYSLIEFKAIDDEQRIIEGIASTPELDRQDDIMDPEGAKYTLPMPLLWQHKQDQPIGQVLTATVAKTGIKIRAQIEKAGLLPEIDRAWTLIKSGLVKGLSIDWQALEAEPIPGKRFARKVTSWNWLALSAVTIPANASANIRLIKSVDAADLAAFGSDAHPHPSGVSDSPRVVKLITPKARDAMKNIREQITSFEATRQAKSARMTEIMQKAADDGTTLDEAQQQEYDGLGAEVKSIDAHLVRLGELEKVNATKAIAVVAPDPQAAAATRTSTTPVITVTDQLPKGYAFARAVMVKVCARLDNRYVVDVAKQMFPDDGRLQKYFETKGNVPAANTQNSLWAGALTYATNLESEFVDFLRPMTILGKFGTNGIPALRSVPFNIRFVAQTTPGEAYWVGEGAPKPVTSYEFVADTLTWAKVATIAVITQEQARFSAPSAEALVRDALAASLRERLDRDFVDPAQAAVANVNPASITNGLTPLSSAGTSADNVRTDIQNLLSPFIEDNMDVESLVLIMPNTLALALSLMVNSLGQPEFPGMTLRGGTLQGIPVITSQYAASLSGPGNLVIAVSANDIMLADDGAVNVDMSTEASLEMKNDPTNNSRTATATSLVSMWQTNSIALKAERFITWKKRRTGAVVYMDDVNWGAIGSPS